MEGEVAESHRSTISPLLPSPLILPHPFLLSLLRVVEIWGNLEKL